MTDLKIIFLIMKINKRKAISTLALIGLTLGSSASAAEIMRKPMFAHLTVAQQSALEEAHQLHKKGKDDEAKHVLESAGIDLPDARDYKNNNSKDKDENFKKFKTLIEQDDFDSFQKMVAGTPMAQIINTEDKFHALVEAHELRLEGHHEEAKEILEDAGIKSPKHKKIFRLK